MKTMKAKDLKNALLQEAVQGKLVPQIAAEGNAADLLNAIRKEKAELIKAGKLKKEKPLPPITDDEKPFDIPESWCWCRFGEIAINLDSKRIPLSVAEREKLKKTYDYYGASGVIDKVDNYLFDKDLLLIGEDGANLLTRSTPIAFIATGKYWVNNHAHVLDFNEAYICLKYIMYAFNAIPSLANYVTGTAQPKMNQERMNSILIPLPPLAEQKRIVAAIEQFMPLIDEYGKKEEVLSELNAAIGGQAKKALLQEAVQGKLVPQIAAEGNAADLLKQIQTEKAQLIKAGKLKKEKPLPPITDDEKPFDIPESWCWCRLGDVCDYLHRGKSPKYGNDRILPIMAQKCNQWDKIYTDRCLFADKQTIERYTDEQYLQVGDTIINSTGGGTVGRTGYVDDYVFTEYPKFVADSHVTVVRGNKKIIGKYLYFFLITPYIQIGLEERCSGSTNQIELGTETIRNYMLPLPPLSEQKRIVSALEKMLPLCERLGK